MAGFEARQVDAVGVVDAAPVGKLIIAMVALCAGVSFLDGFDILAISYVAPVIGGLDAVQGGVRPDLCRALYRRGGRLGVLRLVRRPLRPSHGCDHADRYFRRLRAATVYAYDFSSLFILRMLIGIGLGGALSNAIAMVAEGRRSGRAPLW